MNKVLNYLKYLSIFMILELVITFITSLLNLMGMKRGITEIIIFAFNIILFLILNYLNASKTKKKGYLQGLLLGITFIILMIIIKLILFSNNFSLATLVYYIILLIISVLGGMFGVNKKSEK